MNDCRKSFARAAKSYASHAKVQTEIGTRLLDRLQYFKLQPKRILDLGSGPGTFTRALKKMYPKAQVIACDLSLPMLVEFKSGLFHRCGKIAATMRQLPFADNSFDLVFSNQALHWEALSLSVLEVHRVLAPNALYLFSTLGPDTFKELKAAWASVDSYQHANDFLDMHHVGDALQKAFFNDVVIDREELTLRYTKAKTLCLDLKAQGVRNINPQRRAGLLTPSAFRQFEKNYSALRDKDGLLPLSYEVVYGQGWARLKPAATQEVVVPLSSLKSPSRKTQ